MRMTHFTMAAVLVAMTAAAADAQALTHVGMRGGWIESALVHAQWADDEEVVG